MILKEKPEDFIVTEILLEELKEKLNESGSYLICSLKKINYNTEDAVQLLSKRLNLPRKDISYAGIKDKKAITTQYISIKNGNKYSLEKLKDLTDITLRFEGFLDRPLSLGLLEGNHFEITVRNLEKLNMKSNFNINNTILINYFDEQRFSNNNVEIGRLLIKRDFKSVTKILSEDKKYGESVIKHLEESKNDYVNAIKKIPKRILQLYFHAYQSMLWNESVKEYLKNKDVKDVKDLLKSNKNMTMSIIGFNVEELDPEKTKIINQILEREQITERDFIMREFNEISLEGNQRQIFMNLKNLEMKEEPDDLFSEKYKMIFKFFLGKGSYATMAVKQLLNPETLEKI